MKIQDRFRRVEYPSGQVINDVVDLTESEIAIYCGYGNAFIHVKFGEIISIEYIKNDKDYIDAKRKASAYRDTMNREFYMVYIECASAKHFSKVEVEPMKEEPI